MLLEYFEKSSIFNAELQAAYAWLAKPAAAAITTDERILGVVRYGERMYGSHDFQSRPSRIRINKVIRTIARTAILPAGCTEVIFVGRTGAGSMRHSYTRNLPSLLGAQAFREVTLVSREDLLLFRAA